MTVIYSGLAIGAIYAIVASGYNLVHNCSGLVNFAQAQYVTVGAFSAYVAFSKLGVLFPVAVILSGIVGALVGLVQEVFGILPLASVGYRTENVLMTTLGVSVLIDGIAEFVWGSNTYGLPYFSNLRTITLFGGRLRIADMITIASACVLCIGLHVWSRRSVVGLWSLAATQDRQTAMLCGINVRRLTRVGFMAGGFILGAAGPLIAVRESVTYTIGDSLVILAFVCLAVGGFGNQIGGLLAGLFIGLVQAVVARYFNAAYADLVIFAILLGTLFLRPKGLVGVFEERTV